MSIGGPHEVLPSHGTGGRAILPNFANPVSVAA